MNDKLAIIIGKIKEKKYLWKQWKKICTKYRNLVKLGIPDWMG